MVLVVVAVGELVFVSTVFNQINSFQGSCREHSFIMR
jgi:hypothetical protein